MTQPLPIIDVSGLWAGAAETRRRVAADIGAACESRGFFYIVGAPRTAELAALVLDQARAFFARPLAEKRATAKTDVGSRGYLRFGDPGWVLPIAPGRAWRSATVGSRGRRYSAAMSVRALILALMANAVVQPALAADPWSGDGGAPPFYQWTDPVPAQAGVMLRQEPMQAPRMPAAAQAKRILYSSRTIAGDKPAAVSGALYIPEGPAPAGGWPVVAWAHGTVGIADVCAPSLTGESVRNAPYLNRWLAEGFAVVATDYEGLGTPGMHPYMNVRAEGRGVLDAVRAAVSAYPATLANRVIMVGHSQGSGAAIGAAYLGPDYAPDVRVLGVVSTGLVIQTVDADGARQLDIPPWENSQPMQAAFDIFYFLGLDRSFDPSLSPDDWMTPAAKPVVDAALSSCFRDTVAVSEKVGLSIATAFKRSLAPIEAQEPLHAYLPDAKLSTPVFAGIGLADKMAGLEGQYNFVSAACHAGAPMTWRYYPRVSHSGVVNVSQADSVPFAKALVAGAVPPGNCADLSEPGPLQTPDPAIPMNE